MKIIFVRHGEPLRYEYGIADMGKMEMQLLADYLEDNFSIQRIYSATSQRAMESTYELNKEWKKSIEYCDWLSEFKYPLEIEQLKGSYPWELPPEIWINDDKNLDYKNCLSSRILEGSDIAEKVYDVWNKVDEIIAKHGYKRNGNLYDVIASNLDEIVVVTHFATMAVIMAHMLNISIFIALNMLFMAPSSYTVLATEEIEQGKAIFRCLELGSTKHLYGKNDLKSEYGRQDEIKEHIDGK